jgi:hypothetical protein
MAGSVGAARDFFSAHCGIPREAVAHYVTVVEDSDGDLAALSTCCDGVADASRMLAGALTVLTGNIPVAQYSTAVIVQRDDLRTALKAELPEEVRARFLEALGESDDDGG